VTVGNGTGSRSAVPLRPGLIHDIEGPRWWVTGVEVIIGPADVSCGA
jgi:hypothetical protein